MVSVCRRWSGSTRARRWRRCPEPPCAPRPPNLGPVTDKDPDKRQRGLEMMAAVYGWPEVGDGDGDFFHYTVEHLFAEIWDRPGLSFRDRRHITS